MFLTSKTHKAPRLVPVFLLFGLVAGEVWSPVVTEAAETMADLRLFFGGSTRAQAGGRVELIEFFNRVARDDDGYYLTKSSLLRDPDNHRRAMAQVRKGLLVQNFASWQTASEQLPSVAEWIDVVSYDLEQWKQSKEEWQDIDQASGSMRDIASAYRLVYAGHLSNRLAARNRNDPQSIEHMARHADVYSAAAYPCLEMLDMDRCVADMRKMMLRARSANPNVVIHVGISLEKDVTLAQQYRYIEGNLDLTDGVSIFVFPNRPESIGRLKDFVRLLRDRPRADFDLDFDVDGVDFDLFLAGFTGPDVGSSRRCDARDLDGDKDIDHADFEVLLRCWSGADIPADPDCANP